MSPVSVGARHSPRVTAFEGGAHPSLDTCPLRSNCRAVPKSALFEYCTCVSKQSRCRPPYLGSQLVHLVLAELPTDVHQAVGPRRARVGNRLRVRVGAETKQRAPCVDDRLIAEYIPTAEAQ